MKIKNELIGKAYDLNFKSYFGLMISLNENCYHLWMCDLQKWLREVHNLDVIPNHYGGINFPNTCYNCYINKHLNTESKLTQVYNTYEEALEQGLLEALKLIK